MARTNNFTMSTDNDNEGQGASLVDVLIAVAGLLLIGLWCLLAGKFPKRK